MILLKDEVLSNLWEGEKSVIFLQDTYSNLIMKPVEKTVSHLTLHGRVLIPSFQNIYAKVLGLLNLCNMSCYVFLQRFLEIQAAYINQMTR